MGTSTETVVVGLTGALPSVPAIVVDVALPEPSAAPSVGSCEVHSGGFGGALSGANASMNTMPSFLMRTSFMFEVYISGAEVEAVLKLGHTHNLSEAGSSFPLTMHFDVPSSNVCPPWLSGNTSFLSVKLMS